MRDLGPVEAPSELGTQELEAGMRPSRMGVFAVIACNTVLVLLLFNASALVRWTQQLPSSPVAIWVAERAADWEALTHVSPADIAERLRDLAKVDDGR